MTRLRALAAGLALAVTACSPVAGTASPATAPGAATPAPATAGPGAPGPAGDPLADEAFYLDPKSPAAQQEATWRATGRAADASQIAKIARRPQADWIDTDTTRAEAGTRDLMARAKAARKTAVMALYNIPHRDCGGFSSGGARDAASYRAWINAVVRGIGDNHPIVVLEPDAIPAALTGCLSSQQRTERLSLLAESGAALTRQGARVYLDAGQQGWIVDTTALAGALRDAGIAQLAGFSLNVSNFYPTADVTTYGHTLAAKLGNTHFIIDTSRNGNGTARQSGSLAWCNPPGRALGQPPTATTGDPQLDALLWIKNPGDSDGNCRAGEPAAGQWWPDYALGLAERAH